MKIFAAVAALSFVAVNCAQAQIKPNQLDLTYPARVATYSASITALTPAASATDFFTITGSATKIVRIKHVECNATSTANSTIPINVVLRSTADLTGTSTSPTAIPLDSNDAAATAVVRAYTVNPGTLGTSVGVLATKLLGTVTLASATVEPNPNFNFDYGLNNDKEVVLRSSAAVYALNAIAASFTAGTALNCYIVWTEAGS